MRALIACPLQAPRRHAARKDMHRAHGTFFRMDLPRQRKVFDTTTSGNSELYARKALVQKKRKSMNS